MQSFGIDIPITGSNPHRTVEYLLAQPDLAARRDEWLLEEAQLPLDSETIALVHEPAFVARFMSNGEAAEREVMRTFELVNDDGSYHRYDPARAQRSLLDLRQQSLRLAGGTTRGAELALTRADRFCFYLGGGMHHGQYDFGEGFCPVNDLVIAVRAMQTRHGVGTAWIIDVDAHKGDGTAALTASDPTIASLSVHMADGWPLDQPRTLADGRPNPSYVPSTVDVPIAAGEESTYVARMVAGLTELERQAPEPDFVVVVDGSDPYERDGLPSTQLIRMSREAMLERDTVLYRWIRERALPSVWVMAGNYGDHSWEIYTQFLERQIRGELD